MEILLLIKKRKGHFETFHFKDENAEIFSLTVEKRIKKSFGKKDEMINLRSVYNKERKDR